MCGWHGQFATNDLSSSTKTKLSISLSLPTYILEAGRVWKATSIKISPTLSSRSTRITENRLFREWWSTQSVVSKPSLSWSTTKIYRWTEIRVRSSSRRRKFVSRRRVRGNRWRTWNRKKVYANKNKMWELKKRVWLKSHLNFLVLMILRSLQR